jgi:hypothetical protein
VTRCGAASELPLSFGKTVGVRTNLFELKRNGFVSASAGIFASCDDFRDALGEAVAQVSKPAVSPTSK